MPNDQTRPTKHEPRGLSWEDRLNRATSWPLTLLAGALVPIIIARTLFDVDIGLDHQFVQLEHLIGALFAARFLAGLALSQSRLNFARANVWDLAIIMVTTGGPLAPQVGNYSFAWLRALVAFVRLIVGLRSNEIRHGVPNIVLAVLASIPVAASMVTYAERGAPNGTIHSFGDGLWWAITTITTVGYGDLYPVTAQGRALSAFIMLVGISIFSVLTANVAVTLLRRLGVERETREIDIIVHDIEARLARMEDTLLALQSQVTPTPTNSLNSADDSETTTTSQTGNR